jgi:SNF2 family DNA or RNA helicase
MRTIQPILLQRKKCEHTETLKLKKKVELVVWIPLSTTQRIVYEKYLRKRTVQDAMERKNFAVDVINDLKTISRHPFLLEATEALKKANGKETIGARIRDSDDVDFGSLEHALNSMTLNNNKRGDEEDDKDEGFNIGRAKDSRFNTAKPRGQTAYTAQSAQKSSRSRLDCEDEYDDADCSRTGRKIGANASVFEIAGRKPEVEELFQVRGGKGGGDRPKEHLMSQSIAFISLLYSAVLCRVVLRSVGLSGSSNCCKSHLSPIPMCAQDSVKLRVMVKLTQRLKRAGHRLLVFSQSKKMLDIIQKVLSRC